MNLGKGLQKQIYRNLLTFHYGRKSHDISNKIKKISLRRLTGYATSASPETRRDRNKISKKEGT